MEQYQVNQDLCIGCGMCAGICPHVFRMSDHGKAEAYQPTEDNVDSEAAREGCPVQAISKEQ